MSQKSVVGPRVTPRQCEIAAESYTAFLLARSGYDVLVQYGANQPDYDLVAIKGERTLKVSVKGSQDGGWMLAARYVKAGVNYQAAIDIWEAHQPKGLVFVLVQFKDVGMDMVPRVYIARADELAAQLRGQCHGRGHGSLQEDTRKHSPKGKYDDKAPEAWKFSPQRLDSM